MAAAIKLELDKVDFSSQGRRLQEGESMAKPVKSVQAEAAATTTCGERCDNFDVTVTAFGPALQAISEEVRKLDFLKRVANTLRSTEGDGRAKVDLRVVTATYTPIQVEGPRTPAPAPAPTPTPTPTPTLTLTLPTLTLTLTLTLRRTSSHCGAATGVRALLPPKAEALEGERPIFPANQPNVLSLGATTFGFSFFMKAW